MNSFHFILGEREDVVDSKGKSVKVKKKKNRVDRGFCFQCWPSKWRKAKIIVRQIRKSLIIWKQSKFPRTKTGFPICPSRSNITWLSKRQAHHRASLHPAHIDALICTVWKNNSCVCLWGQQTAVNETGGQTGQCFTINWENWWYIVFVMIWFNNVFYHLKCNVNTLKFLLRSLFCSYNFWIKWLNNHSYDCGCSMLPSKPVGV